MKSPPAAVSPVVLGIEGGGTRTSVRLMDAAGRMLASFQTGPAVLPLMSDRELRSHLKDISARLPCSPQAVAIGLAGARAAADQERLKRAITRLWPGRPSVATNDLETALAAAEAPVKPITRVLVLSGTGSCCFGRSPTGATAKVGGRGHIIGDRASACDIGLRALRAVMADLDHRGRLGTLGAAILNALKFNEPEQMIPWSVQAAKTEIANLAITVFATALGGDRLAKKILSDAAEMLAQDACACASQLEPAGRPVEFILNGGVMLRNPGFMKQVAKQIRRCWPKAVVTPLATPSVYGAVKLARLAAADAPSLPRIHGHGQPLPFALPEALADLSVLAQSPTEKRNPKSADLDRLPLVKCIELMLKEDEQIPAALMKETTALKKVVAQVVKAFEKGGRLFYAGAGTSGRLGVLDASEIPPTFRAPSEQVQGIIAGGRQAIWSAVEGAEDDVQAGAQSIQHRQLGPNDVLVGIAASGRTPFVWGALHEANRRGAFTALLCFNPAMKPAVRRVKEPLWKPKVILAPNVGPEVLTGSTRLKSGTATKLVLNIITTLAMTKTGKVIGNLMVDLNPSNVKLRDRAVRILCELTGCTSDQARSALNASGWVVKDAYARLGGQVRKV